jgi:acetylornithine aminotransferase/acetylornithine/N-succinyldiaminopimelate aminotransferase
LNRPARPFVEQALEQGVMLNLVQDNVLRFLPSFLLERRHVDVAIELISRIIHAGTGGVEPSPARKRTPAKAEALEPATV